MVKIAVKEWLNSKKTFLNLDKSTKKASPEVSESTINRVLNELKKDGVIETTEQGRSSKWVKK